MTENAPTPPVAYDFDLCPSPNGGIPMALFRDRRTVEALRGADDEVRAYFIASGFGVHVYDSGFAPGTYPAGDHDARIALVERLSANLELFDVGGHDTNGFDFGAFMAHLAEARPVEGASGAPADVLAHPRAVERVVAVGGVTFLTMVYLLVGSGGALTGI